MNFNFSKTQQDLYELVGYLAREHFAPRAEESDRLKALPLDNLRDLHKHGLLGLTIAREHGGLGSGVMGEDPLLYLLAIEQTARLDLSTAHCLHIHLHATHFIDQVATAEQRKTLLGPVLERGALIGAVGSEPGRTARGVYMLNTTAQEFPKGIMLNGRKNYATLAGVAEYMIVFATLKEAKPMEGHIGVAVPQGAKGYEVVQDSWDPIGMRSAVSPDVVLDNCMVPSSMIIGSPGVYPNDRWQARHYLSLAAQYLGASEGLFDSLTEYIPVRGTAGEQFTQLRLGEIRVLIDSMRWLIYRSAWLWNQGDLQQAELFAMVARQHATRTVVDIMDKSAQIAGSHALTGTGKFQRMMRDLRIHTLHSNVDKTAATIGKYHLGQNFDITDRL
ncbi:acyl-CoA dehydrogenase family protein [Pusillimonas sp. SM2304]|uniref:acyl-CoA dehydrogenase family protein n=1 Tax=Pusillimonas sp. SM2304 TaxID=3073241 RepID=UPI002876063C|nr:acyl-CoA dehydrogenase family protein [Pusillimonas sp. SM2304]MDS1139902.1 acyl-CoA dehydrogenase family protein [Pusillimonas sp. SM2304]